MDHKEQHHQHHQKEREHEKKEKKEHEQEAKGPPIHPAWFFAAGLVLVIVAVIVWTFLVQ
jgi:hypothetical protein